MATDYIFSLSTNFPGGLNSTQLYTQINNSAIVPSLLAINTDGDVVTIQFNSALSGAEETILNDLVANYVYSSGPAPPVTPLCKFRTSSTTDVNAFSPTTVVWDITDIIDDTHFELSEDNTKIKILEDGYYEIDCLCSFQTTETGEFNNKMNILLNAENLPVASRLAYFKNTNPATKQSSNYVNDTLMLQQDDELGISMTGIGDAGVVNLLSGQSRVIIKKYLQEYSV